jgi:CMP-N,N'-diacetyllegionaminic acid synthase
VNILGVVPARGGSKSVPRKNIRPIAGKPLIAYTVLAGTASRHINRVVVSTDDEEIADVARQFGAEVPFLRPAHLAEDDVTDLPVFAHCLNWLEEHEGYRPNIVVHLRPTAPLRTAAHIDGAIDVLLESPEADSVRSVCPAPQHPLKIWRVEDGWLAPFVPEVISGIAEAFNQPRQQLPQSFVQNGAVDVIRAPVIGDLRSMTGRRIKPFFMDEAVSVNIDSLLDWQFAEWLLERRRG